MGLVKVLGYYRVVCFEHTPKDNNFNDFQLNFLSFFVHFSIKIQVGSHVPELSGSHVPELSDSHVPELSGSHVPQLSGSHVSEFSGTKLYRNICWLAKDLLAS